MILLRPELAPMLAAVPFDLPLRDGPDRADLASAELPVADLVTQRGSRQPETVGGFVEGEHLLRGLPDSEFLRSVSALGGGLVRIVGDLFESSDDLPSEIGLCDVSHVSTLHAGGHGVKRVLSA